MVSASGFRAPCESPLDRPHPPTTEIDIMQPQLSTPQRPGMETRLSVEDFYQLLGILGRGWRFIAIGAVISLTLAAVQLAKAKPVYQASARLLVLQQGGRPLSVAGGGGG